MALSATTQSMTERLFHAIERSDLCTDPRSSTNAARLENIDLVDGVVQDFIGALSLADALEHFEQAGVTVGPVKRPSQLVDDPFVQGRESIVGMKDSDMGVMPMHNVVPRFSHTPGAVRTEAPGLGQHTHAVLSDLGLSATDIERLGAEGVV